MDDKYYLLNRLILKQPIQMELSQKQKIFSGFFFPFLGPILNFQHLAKKDDHHSSWISGNTCSEKHD